MTATPTQLDTLLARGTLGARHHAAATRMRDDWRAAHCGGGIGWDALPGTTATTTAAAPDAATEAATDAARKRLAAARAAAGPGLTDILQRVVCEDQPLADAERSFDWPARAGKVVLGIALERVAGVYGV